MKLSIDLDSLFHFKQFSISHSQCSMKVGVDGVLIGAWGEISGKRGLDVGCGSGLIALMCAQRNQICFIDAIDNHKDSVKESQYNFNHSPWRNRLKAFESDAVDYFQNEENKEKYDFIISNPPFFRAGISPKTVREKARHAYTLTPEFLIEKSSRLLKKDGTLSIIIPYLNIEMLPPSIDLSLNKICYVSDKPGKSPKRIMLCYKKNKEVTIEDHHLNLRDEEGNYDNNYRLLTKDFYLAF